MSFGNRLKKARSKAGLSQKELAARLGTTPQNLAQYENGKRNPKKETLAKMADALDMGYTYAKNGEPYFYCFVDAVEPQNSSNNCFNELQLKDATNMQEMEQCENPEESENLKSDVAFRLKKLRLEKGITQRELAQNSGLAVITIQQYERGLREPRLDNLKRIAYALHVPVDSLFTEVKPAEPATIAAHFDIDEYTPEEMEQIKLFAEFIKSRRAEDSGLLAAHSRTPDQQQRGSRSTPGSDQKASGAAPEETTQVPTPAPIRLDDEPEVLAAHARTDVEHTPEGLQHDLDIMNDDSKWNK